MEFNQHVLLLDEIVALTRENWTSFPTSLNEFFPTSLNEFFPTGLNYDSFLENPILSSSSNHPSVVEFCTPFNVHDTIPEFDLSAAYDTNTNTNMNVSDTIMPIQEDYYCPTMMEEMAASTSTSTGKTEAEIEELSNKIPVFNTVCWQQRKKSGTKLHGQPSKNLMAERRRRKRLNDRLSMLRSIVPKISKMDRTSILADTIDYMKELLERIKKNQEDGNELGIGTDQSGKNLGIYKENINTNEILTRNSPKFDVERRNTYTRVEICCPTMPGLLVSTVNTLEALGLEIQQCVISCFNDFSVQASCSEGSEQRKIMSSEDVKQAIFRNAGYGGRCQ